MTDMSRLRPRLVLLDRDGVLNRNLDNGVLQVADWEWLPGAVDAVRRMAGQGVRIAIVTNQASIGRGRLTTDALDEIHIHMLEGLRLPGLGLTDVLYCPHLPEAGCACRKPQPGMLVHAFARAHVSPQEALLVGDHVSDLEAAGRVGCPSVHVQSGRGAAPVGPLPHYLGSVPDLTAVCAAVWPHAAGAE
ncbi:HAD-IIIA family hydrolase [Streptomyces sp. DSM 41524]|uniref:D,D-heptose 1,7-bisphosphate phosphatase n=1 Tax=Streptomyces asiaticus subsp. ignotus TaxID=3098222 RepID=A0ABU7Q3Z7_9ACTN|nr:HAD-IIIA family hydrolase [Streptomyces sp. DSM 41524]